MRPWSHALWQSYLILRSFRIRDTLSRCKVLLLCFLTAPTVDAKQRDTDRRHDNGRDDHFRHTVGQHDRHQHAKKRVARRTQRRGIFRAKEQVDQSQNKNGIRYGAHGPADQAGQLVTDAPAL